MIGALVALGVVLLVVGAAWASKHVKHPEQTATHLEDVPEDTTSDRFYRKVDRPAGPDAEDPAFGLSRATDEARRGGAARG